MNIRIGKTVVVSWIVTTNGENVSLEDKDLTLIVESPFKKWSIPQFEVEDNIIRFTLQGSEQKTFGKHTITLYENYKKTNQSVVDICDGFNFVSCNCEEDLGVLNTSFGGNIEVVYGGDFRRSYISYEPQELTDEQKQQARENIGALTDSDLNSVTFITDIEEL